MPKRKSIRERGKIKFSRAFQELNEGDSVSIIIEKSMQPKFPKRMQGRTGKVFGKRGRSFLVKIKDSNKEKEFIVDPVHLKKIKMDKKEQ